MSKPFEWTPARVQFIRENYAKLGRSKIAEMWGVKPIVIGRKAHYLGITEPAADRANVRFDWTPERLAILKTEYMTRTAEEFAEMWGMTAAAVTQRAYRMGLSNRKHCGRPGHSKRPMRSNGAPMSYVGKRGDALEIVETVSKRRAQPRKCAWREPGTAGNRFQFSKACLEPAERGSMWCRCCQAKVDKIREAA